MDTAFWSASKLVRALNVGVDWSAEATRIQFSLGGVG